MVYLVRNPHPALIFVLENIRQKVFGDLLKFLEDFALFAEWYRILAVYLRDGHIDIWRGTNCKLAHFLV